MPNGLLGTEVKSRNRNDDHTRGRRRDRHNSRSVPRRREESNLTPELVVITIESGVIDAGNTIISHPNTLIPQLMRRLTMKT